MSYYIYSLTDKNNEIIYIGYTSRKLSKRFSEHRSRKIITGFEKINLICKKSTLIEAKNTESTLINLIGTKKLKNKVSKNTEAKKLLNLQMIKNGKVHGNLNKPKKRKSVNSGLVTKNMQKFNMYKNGTFVGTFINKSEAAKVAGMTVPHFISGFKKGAFKRKNIILEII